jgi:hypothetical protein
MNRVLLATALALAAGLAAAPASAQLRPDNDRLPSAPPSTQPRPEGEGPSDGRSPPNRRVCAANWKTYDQNSDGALTGKELDRLRRVIRDVDTDYDGTITSAEYQAGCANGVLKDGDITSEPASDRSSG